MDPNSPAVLETIKSIQSYTDISMAPTEAVNKQTRFEVFLKQFFEEFHLNALAIQC